MGTVSKDLVEAMAFAVDHMQGKVKARTHVVEVDDVDVKAIRRQLQMTQARFAETFGLELTAIRAWEQGQRRPEKAARLYLKVIARNPDMVRAAIAA